MRAIISPAILYCPNLILMKMWLPGQSITLSVVDPDIGDEHEFGLVDAEGGEDNHMFTLVGNETALMPPMITRQIVPIPY